LELPLPDTLNATVSASGYLLVQSILGLLTILTSVKAVFSGIAKIFKGKSDCDSLASMGLVVSFIATVLAYVSGQKVVEDRMLNVYMCLGIIGMLCNLWGKNLILKREEHNFRYISKDKDKFGLYCMQDYSDAESITEGLVDGCPVTAYNKKAHFTTDFVKYTYSRDMADKFAQVATPVIASVSLLVALIAGIVYNKTFESQIPVAITSIFSMLVSFCSCFSLGINLNSMLNRVSEKYPRREGALLGYQAVEDFYDTNSIVLSANDVFPNGSVELCAMKLFASGRLDETLIYAISLAKDSNSILAPTLMKIVEDKTDYLRKVESYTYEDGKGICGWIDSKRILMGNRELMEAHNIENLPTKSKEAELVGKGRDAVYVSISGNLALMLIVQVTTHREVERFLQTFEENNVSIALTSVDFLVSVERVSTLYDLEPESLKIIPYSVYQDNKVYFEDKPQCSSSIVTSGNVNVLANLLVLTKKIHRNALIGNILYAVACILGILIGISFITMGAFKELNPTMILFYNGVCTLITILLTKLKI
jgi:Cu+-exporting ATPase